MADFCYTTWFKPLAAKYAVGDHVLSVLEYLPELEGKHYRLLESLCCMLWQIGFFNESLHHCRRLYDSTLQTYGSGSMEAGFVALRLAGCYFNSGKQRESVSLYRQGLDSMLASRATDGEDLAMVYEKAARSYTWSYDRDIEKTEAYFQINLDIRLHQLEAIRNGETLPPLCERYVPDLTLALSRLAEIYHEIGRMHQTTGEYEKAVAYAQKHIDIMQEVNPDNFAGRAYGYHDLGWSKYHLALRTQGVERTRYLKEAEDMLKTARDYTRERSEERSMHTLDCEEHLADVYTAQQRYPEAAQGYTAALTMAEKMYDEAHHRVAALRGKA